MKTNLMAAAAASALLATFLAAAPAAAQDEEEAKEPWRTRVALGPQLVPSYPGADGHSLRPLIDVARARGDTPFRFEAPDESFGFALIKAGGLGIGPALNFEGSRTAEDVGAPLDKVGSTFELGGFVEYAFGPSFRLRAEGRKGLGGHKAWTGTVGADYVTRDEDAWLFSIGPRVTLSDGRYHRAYFGVTAPEAVATGLPVYTPEGGVQAVGGTAGFIFQFNKRWGLYSTVKYDRLIEDAGRSPVVREFGSRNQLSGGVALTYTFGGNRS